MNLPLIQAKTEEPPNCFGKQWEQNAPECAGGSDPTYLHPSNQTHVRETCAFFGACGARTQAAKQARQAAPIPTSHLFRPNGGLPQVAPQEQSGQFQQYAKQLEAQRNAQLAVIAQQTQQKALAAQQQIAYPFVPGQVHPAHQYQLNYQMPGYLTVPEELPQGGSLWGVLFREILRAIFKSSGHTVSHFFDVNPLRRNPPQ